MIVRLSPQPRLVIWLVVCLLYSYTGCRHSDTQPPVDIILFNGNVYTLTWEEPSRDGTPGANAPYQNGRWFADATALAIRGDKIAFTGSDQDARRYRGPQTLVIDLKGATVIPGLVDSHVHIAGLGEKQVGVDLTGVQTEEEAVDIVSAYAANIPPGQWIIGQGWDEGAWAGRYPTMKLLSEKVPDHPVVLMSLHGFAVWGNQQAFDNAGINKSTKPPAGGYIVKDRDGRPAGVLLNRATTLLNSVIPAPSIEQLKSYVVAGLEVMARDGFVAVHEAGADSRLIEAFQSLAHEGRLPIRVYAMLSARDEVLCREWQVKGPTMDRNGMLIIRSVKAYYDAALGSRGARLLDDYSDMPGYRGVSGEQYGFNRRLVIDMMNAGFQVGIHAIGDAGNRETLEFLETAIAQNPKVLQQRNRIEHAQVIHPADFRRFTSSQIIASMQPPHCVEDKAWAEDRLGPERIRRAYAWRTLRRAGARLIFNSDLTGSDHKIFYGLHSAITRRDKSLQPAEGWYPEERLSPEEALRAYTSWAAYAGFQERETGTLAPGRNADITVMDIDPLQIGSREPRRLLDGRIRMTIVGGKIVWSRRN